MLPDFKTFLTERVPAKDIHAAWPDAEKANSMPGKTARQSGHHNLQKQLDYNIHAGNFRYIGTAYGHHHYHSKSPTGNDRVFHHESMNIAKNGASKYAHTGIYHGQHMEELGNIPGSDMTEAKKKPTIKVSHKGPIGYKIADIGPGGKEHNVVTKDYPLKEVFSDAIHIKKGTVQRVPKSSPDDSEMWIARHPNGKIHYTKDKTWAHAWAKGSTRELDKPQEWKKRFIPPAKAIQEDDAANYPRKYPFTSEKQWRLAVVRRGHKIRVEPIRHRHYQAVKDGTVVGIFDPRVKTGHLIEYTEPLHFLSRMEPEDNQTKSAEFLTKLSQVLPKDDAEKQAIKEGMENLEPGKHIYLGQGGEVRHPDKSQKHYYLAHHREKGLALFGHDNKDVVELRASQYAANGAHHHLQEDKLSYNQFVGKGSTEYRISYRRAGRTPLVTHNRIILVKPGDSPETTAKKILKGAQIISIEKIGLKEDANLLARDHDNKDVVELRASQYAANGAHHHLQEDIRSIKREILELKRDMKKNGIPIRSFMNGGHTPESMRANQELFRLKTALEREQKSNIYEDANLLAREDAMPPGTHRTNKNGTFSAAHPSSGKIRHFWSPDASKAYASGKKWELPMEVRTKIARTAMDSYRKKHGLSVRSEDNKPVPPLFMSP